ncbi:serine O-acetyltransferase [Leptolyngbya sp. NM2-A1]
MFQRDPVARNWLEVLLCYPGFHALCFHRIAHKLHRAHIPLVPRLISQLSRWLTGVEIHPGATIGKGMVIDHGMGIVIGETAIIGDYGLIYQGATLGGTGKERGKRHPTLGNHVVVGAGAKVLGNIDIGSHVRIGAGSVVLRDTPDYSTVVGVPGRIVRHSGLHTEDSDYPYKRDLEAEVIGLLFERVKQLEKQINQLQQSTAMTDQVLDGKGAIANSDHLIQDFLDGAGI